MKSEQHNNQKLKNDCRRFSPQLNDYVDGRLTSDNTWQIKDHLVVCNACLQKVNNFTSVMRLLNDAPKHETAPSFMSALEARIASSPAKTSTQSRIDRLFNGILRGMLEERGFGLRFTAPFAAAAACAVFACIVLVHPLYTSTSVTSSVSSMQSDMPDSAVLQTCINQHRSETTSDPLADTSAQLLSTSVDSLPYDASKNKNLSDDDAAVLLDEEM
jgi:anti-sigma factor RsiW